MLYPSQAILRIKITHFDTSESTQRFDIECPVGPLQGSKTKVKVKTTNRNDSRTVLFFVWDKNVTHVLPLCMLVSPIWFLINKLAFRHNFWKRSIEKVLFLLSRPQLQSECGNCLWLSEFKRWVFQSAFCPIQNLYAVIHKEANLLHNVCKMNACTALHCCELRFSIGLPEPSNHAESC